MTLAAAITPTSGVQEHRPRFTPEEISGFARARPYWGLLSKVARELGTGHYVVSNCRTNPSSHPIAYDALRRAMALVNATHTASERTNPLAAAVELGAVRVARMNKHRDAARRHSEAAAAEAHPKTVDVGLLRTQMYSGLRSRVAKQLGVAKCTVARVAKGGGKSARISAALKEETDRIEREVQALGATVVSGAVATPVAAPVFIKAENKDGSRPVAAWKPGDNAADALTAVAAAVALPVPTIAAEVRASADDPIRTRIVLELARGNNPTEVPAKKKREPRKRFGTQDSYFVGYLWATNFSRQEINLFWTTLAARTGKPVAYCRRIVAVNYGYKLRYDWKVCREAVALKEEWGTRYKRKQERKRIMRELGEWLTTEELKAKTLATESTLLAGQLSGRLIVKPNQYGQWESDDLQYLAASALPAPTSEIVDAAWIARAVELTVAAARAELMLSAHLEDAQ